jgi:hypothetical protein
MVEKPDHPIRNPHIIPVTESFCFHIYRYF